MTRNDKLNAIVEVMTDKERDTICQIFSDAMKRTQEYKDMHNAEVKQQ